MKLDKFDGHSDMSAPVKWYSSKYAWYVTILLMTSYFLAYVDRSVINLLIEPIKQDLALSDTQMSFIVGSSFAIFFAIAGIPLGRLADTAPRKWVVALSALFWSLMTALCGTAKSFVVLFACRIGVGVGEAGLNPSAMSMISDMFPREKRQFAITLYIVSGVFGAGFAVVIGAGLLSVGEHLSASGAILPMLRPWQWVFILISLPALPLAALMIFTVREPERRGQHGEIVTDNEKLPLGEVFAYYRQRWHWFVPMLVASSLILTVSVGYLVWGIPLVQRMYGLDAQKAALAFGLPLFACGVLGNFISSWFANVLMRKGHADGIMRAMLIVCIVTAAPVTFAPLVPGLWPMVAMLAPFLGMLTAMSALPQITIQLLMPNRLRGQTIAIFYFVINIVSYSVGPTSVALLTDVVFKDEMLLRYSLVTVSAVAFPIAIALFAWALPYFRKEAIAAKLGSVSNIS